MDMFDVTCRCGTQIAVSVPSLRSARPFTCPGCGRTLSVDDDGSAVPHPQADTGDTPAVQAVILHFHGRSVRPQTD